MSWRDRYIQANWRGFAFLSDSHDAQYGRRLVQHSYPNANDIDVEDFGDAPRTYKINAYFIGDDYDLEANGFLALLNQPGADWLQHPWLGQVWVRPRDWTRTERSDQNGYCTISIDFIDGGRAPYLPTIDQVDSALEKVATAQQVMIAAYAPPTLSTDALTELGAEIDQHLDKLRKVVSAVSLPLKWADKAINVINGVKNEVGVLLGMPQQYAGALMGVANALGLGDADLTDPVQESTRARAVTRLTQSAINPPAITTSAAVVAVTGNYKLAQSAEAGLRAQTLIIAAALTGLTQYDNANARDTVLTALTNAIDAQLNTVSDAVFDALVDMRSAIVDALASQIIGSQAQRLVTQPQPAVVLARQLQTTEPVLMSINNITHPLFVSGQVVA